MTFINSATRALSWMSRDSVFNGHQVLEPKSICGTAAEKSICGTEPRKPIFRAQLWRTRIELLWGGTGQWSHRNTSRPFFSSTLLKKDRPCPCWKKTLRSHPGTFLIMGSSQFAEGLSDSDNAADFVSRLLNISSGLFWQLRHNWPPLLLSGRPCWTTNKLLWNSKKVL